MSRLIQEIEAEQLKKNIPDFRAGDTVIVQVEVREGTRTRVQAYEGVVIAKRNRGLNSSFTVRKISNGEGVERIFQTHSPIIKGIEVKRRGQVRKAKLYYLRGLTGKSARIRERLDYTPADSASSRVEAGTTAAAAAGSETESSTESAKE